MKNFTGSYKETYSRKSGFTGEIIPIAFSPSPQDNITYRSVIILLCNEEWKQIEEKKLALPEGWNLTNMQEFVSSEKTLCHA